MIGRYVDIDGIRTHYFEAGDGPTVVLLHSGKFGGAAELSWEFVLPELARHFHVLAPDVLGFGRTDKIFDFADPRGRSMRHLSQFVRRMLAERGHDQADFVGNSMGASNLLRVAALNPELLPIRSLVIASGGGFVPVTPERQTLLAYDGTPEAMRAMLRAMLHDPKWAADDAYIARRQELALLPGAWECAAAPRLKLAARSRPAEGFGQPDSTPYESIRVPTLIVAGAEDRLRLPGYAEEFGRRIPCSEVHVFERCGHCPNLEQPDRFNELVVGFLRRVHLGDIAWTKNL